MYPGVIVEAIGFYKRAAEARVFINNGSDFRDPKNNMLFTVRPKNGPEEVQMNIGLPETHRLYVTIGDEWAVLDGEFRYVEGTGPVSVSVYGLEL